MRGEFKNQNVINETSESYHKTQVGQAQKENRKSPINIRFTEREKRFLAEQAEDRCLSLSEFVRYCVLNKKLPRRKPPQVNVETYLELCDVSKELQELNVSVNEGRAYASDGLLEKVRYAVRSVGLQITGQGIDR